jgi:hypothetical protein
VRREVRRHPTGSTADVCHPSTAARCDELDERHQQPPVDRTLGRCADLGPHEPDVPFDRRLVDGSGSRHVIILRHLATLRGSFPLGGQTLP